jgi:predicted nucleotidyltransferase
MESQHLLCLNEIKFRVKQKFQSLFRDDLITLVLFGSQARGDATTESDIDVLVVLKNKQLRNSKRDEVLDFIGDLCLEFGVLVSCVYVSQAQFETEKSPLLLNIRREGIVL